ncbi:MAG: helix-turn-helix transcriptional regulator [Bacteroidales bacterium]|nr:helix-turn-helix transcriptional regulator [Candidatus Cryptobacteroides onthequi]MCQ2164789.1 helix-turn-helix transcriptional regulator [Bacteroidales bacterium]
MNPNTNTGIPDSAFPALTSRETEILKLIASGRTSQEIAQVISLSHETIKWYRKRLLQKTGSANSAELIHKATEAGLL